MNKRITASYSILLAAILTITQFVQAQSVFRLERVEPPSGTVRELSRPEFRVELPQNWATNPWGEFTSFTPRGAYFSREEANIITHGVYLGIVPQRGGLAETIQGVIDAGLEENPHLRQESDFQTASISGEEALVSNSSGDFEFTGLREIVVSYAAVMPDGRVFFIATVCPEVDYEKYQPVFNDIIDSIEFTGSAAAADARDGADSITGYAEVFEVDESQCRFQVIGVERIYSGNVTYRRLAGLTGRRITNYPQAVQAINGRRVTVAVPKGTAKTNPRIDFGNVRRVRIGKAASRTGPRSGWAERSDERETVLTLAADVLFDYDKSDIKPEAIPVLVKLAGYIKENKIPLVDLSGHTDAIGSDGYNQGLSERRADSVRRWLVTVGGVPASVLRTRGFGESRPVAPNSEVDGSDDPEGRQRNRRVEVSIPRKR